MYLVYGSSSIDKPWEMEIAMHHIEIYVRDLEMSREFYSWLLETLGFEIFQEWDEGFSYNKDSFYIVFVQTRSQYVGNKYNRCNVGLNHLAFTCDSEAKVDAIREQLVQRGINLLYDDEYPNAGGPDHYAVYFEDPDRIKLEIVAV